MALNFFAVRLIMFVQTFNKLTQRWLVDLKRPDAQWWSSSREASLASLILTRRTNDRLRISSLMMKPWTMTLMALHGSALVLTYLASLVPWHLHRCLSPCLSWTSLMSVQPQRHHFLTLMDNPFQLTMMIWLQLPWLLHLLFRQFQKSLKYFWTELMNQNLVENLQFPLQQGLLDHHQHLMPKQLPCTNLQPWGVCSAATALWSAGNDDVWSCSSTGSTPFTILWSAIKWPICANCTTTWIISSWSWFTTTGRFFSSFCSGRSWFRSTTSWLAHGLWWIPVPHWPGGWLLGGPSRVSH